MSEHTSQDIAWERDVLEKLVLASVQEQRRARRWGIFFKLLFWGLIAAVLIYSFSDHSGARKPLMAHTALITVDGEIDSEVNDAQSINEGLRAAFEEKQAQGIVLQLNSPGGSPVQAGEVYDEIKRLRELHPDKKLYAVIGDTCASGCYYIAAAADEIYANKASLVGSIGVLFNGFGLVDALTKVGVERRLIVSGSHKGFMDPFSPTDPENVAFLQEMLDEVHQQFIDEVKSGRGDRLKENDLIFSGLAWTGQQSLQLGLIDGLGSTDYVARDIIGAETVIEYTSEPNFFARFSKRVGASIAYALRAGAYPQLG